MSRAVQNNGAAKTSTPTPVTNKKLRAVDNQKLNRKRGTIESEQNVAGDVLMMGSTGYEKSWSVIQRAVDHLMTERMIPVPKATMSFREPRHLPKRRVFVSLYRDVQCNNLILRAQQFQKEFELEGLPFTRKVIIDYPTERQRPRRDRHYDFWPFFEQLPDLVEEKEEEVAPEDIKEDEIRDVLGFASSDDASIELAEECKENSTFLPAPLSEELTKEIGQLFQKKVGEKSMSFVQKYMKKGPFAKIF